MANKPRITIYGYVARIEERQTRTGITMLKISIPIADWSSKQQEGYKTAYSGNGFEATAWNSIVIFGDKADNAKTWLRKGAYVACDVSPFGQAESGVMYPRIWMDKASYEWKARDVRQGDIRENDEPWKDDEPYTDADYAVQDEPPPGFTEEDEIPF